MIARVLNRIGLDRTKELSLLGVIVLNAIFFNMIIDQYFSGRFVGRLALGVAVTAVVAAGQAIVIIARHIDLSVGSIVGITAYTVGEVVQRHPDVSPVVVVLVAMLIGALLGVINGVLVAVARVPSIIVTLGTMAIYRTWLIRHAKARTITADSLPDWLINLPRSSVASIGTFDVRTMFVIAVVVVVVLQIIFRHVRGARRVYAIGSNPDAAAQTGLPAKRIVVASFAACGMFAGIGGFLFLARFGTITVNAGEGVELQAIAAAVVGGVSTLGGSGTMVGVLFGAILIELLGQSLARVQQISEFWKDAVLGVLILVAIVIDGLVTRMLKRRRQQAVAG